MLELDDTAPIELCRHTIGSTYHLSNALPLLEWIDGRFVRRNFAC